MTHFPAAGMAVLIIEDLVSRKWISHVVSSEETHTQVQLGFEQALDAEGLLEPALERAEAIGRSLDLDGEDQATPILLAVSDNGSQMIAGDTRKFMAMVAIAQHFGRPATPTDQAWIESLNGTLKAEWPHLNVITEPAVLRAELDLIRAEYNTSAAVNDVYSTRCSSTRRTTRSLTAGSIFFGMTPSFLTQKTAASNPWRFRVITPPKADKDAGTPHHCTERVDAGAHHSGFMKSQPPLNHTLKPDPLAC